MEALEDSKQPQLHSGLKNRKDRITALPDKEDSGHIVPTLFLPTAPFAVASPFHRGIPNRVGGVQYPSVLSIKRQPVRRSPNLPNNDGY